MSTVELSMAVRKRGWVVAAVAVATAAGLALSASAPRLPGAEGLGAEDVVDAVAGVAAGVLGWALLRRRIAVGLGRAMVALAVVVAAVWLCGGVADLLAAGGPPPLPARVLQVLAGALFIGSYALLVFPVLLLVPDGRLPGRPWRPVAWLAVAAIALSMLATVLQPGPIDQDVPGWGNNPLGIHALAGITHATAAVGLVLAVVALAVAVVLYVVRLVRTRGQARRQMLIVLVGVLVMISGIVTDGLLPGTLSAVVIFAALFGSIAWALLTP
jgi:two-component system NarL family sensor kinase